METILYADSFPIVPQSQTRVPRLSNTNMTLFFPMWKKLGTRLLTPSIASFLGSLLINGEEPGDEARYEPVDMTVWVCMMAAIHCWCKWCWWLVVGRWNECPNRWVYWWLCPRTLTHCSHLHPSSVWERERENITLRSWRTHTIRWARRWILTSACHVPISTKISAISYKSSPALMSSSPST